MTTGGMAADINSLGVATEALGVLVDPYDAALNLVSHGHQIAASLDDIVEVEHNEMGTGIDQHLGLGRTARRDLGTPSAAMDEDIDRRVLALSRVDVERLDWRRSIGQALRCAETLAPPLAVAMAARNYLPRVRCIDKLIVGVVEFLLIHVQPNRRPFRTHCRRGLR